MAVQSAPAQLQAFGTGKQRISHVGFVQHWAPPYLITVEGNSNHAVECRRRPILTIYKVANWLTIP